MEGDHNSEALFLITLSANVFLDALASLDLKLSVSESVIDVFTASASTGLSDLFLTKTVEIR